MSSIGISTSRTVAPFSVAGAAAAALLDARFVRVPALWLALAGFVGVRLFVDWPLPDNHAYLTAYCCLAFGVGLLGVEPRQTIKLAARQLLALTFVLAVVWKAFLSPDYLDGRFFRVTLLKDDRFTSTVTLLTGLSRADILENRKALAPPPPGSEPFDWQPVHEPPAFRALVLAATWGALALEALVAFLFVLPLGNRRLTSRNAALLAFCIVTYAVASVPGFGWVLLALGLSQCAAEARRWRAAYMATFFLVLWYAEIPWAQLALRHGARLGGP